MPNVLHADETIETQLASALRRIRQLEKRSSGGFDPNADPVVIGQTAIADATGPTGSSSPTTDGAVAIGRDAHTENSAAIAIGDGTYAVGQYSTVIGDHADAEGVKWDIAIGHLARASWATGAQQSIAIGANAHAGGTTTDTLRDIAIGVSSVADGGSTIAIGDDAVVSAGIGSIAIGHTALVNGVNGAIALGQFTEVDNGSGVALGDSSYVGGDDAVALGPSASAEANSSVAVGYGTTANIVGQICLGRDNRHFVEVRKYNATYGSIVVMQSPNGTRYALQVSNAGALSAIASPV